MLQRIIAALLLVGGLVAVGLGVASATVWRDSDTVVATTAYTGDGTLLVTEPGVLDLVAEDVTIRATAPGEQQVTLAIGREVDVTGWVGEDAHGVVTGLSDWDALATRAVEPAAAEETPAEGETPADGESPAEGETPAAEETPADGDAPAEETPAEGETAVVGVDPAGSDMWFEESTGAGSASLRWSDQPGRWQLLVAGVGEGAVAPTLELSWPREVETPLLWPGVIGGAVLILLGLGIGAASLRPKRRGPSGRGTATSATPTVAPAASPQTPAGEHDPGENGGEAPTDTAQVRMLTRRELREREESDRLAQQQTRAQKPRRAWLTGQIPIVARGERRPKTAAQPAVDAADGHPTTQDSATTRADAWRRAWGFTPGSTGTSEAPDPQRDPDETKDSTR
ncbi:hypothetical protein [Cellulosimicrobium sp. SH8]|uniref:hypothetical protein n=1 Tax=Cellulosimicrobium sp. SH8 TaxID=2952936 RepID=UPI0021F34456|nr:hypothetical protein [Cellulosimicrobium sp. SH8]